MSKNGRGGYGQPWIENDPFVARRLEAVERSEGYGDLRQGACVLGEPSISPLTHRPCDLDNARF